MDSEKKLVQAVEEIKVEFREFRHEMKDAFSQILCEMRRFNDHNERMSSGVRQQVEQQADGSTFYNLPNVNSYY